MDYANLANVAALTSGGLLQVPTEIIPFMEYLEKEVNPKSFLELGVCQGGTFFIWTALCQPGGIKLGIDLPNGPWGTSYTRYEKEMDANKHKFQTFAPNTFVLYEDTRSPEAENWVKRKLEGRRLDFIFIDADHTYEGVKADYVIYSKFVRPGGIVVFHDIKDTQNHRDKGCTVYKLWKELEGDKLEFVDPTYDWGGIGVLKV